MIEIKIYPFILVLFLANFAPQVKGHILTGHMISNCSNLKGCVWASGLILVWPWSSWGMSVCLRIKVLTCTFINGLWWNLDTMIAGVFGNFWPIASWDQRSCRGQYGCYVKILKIYLLPQRVPLVLESRSKSCFFWALRKFWIQSHVRSWEVKRWKMFDLV